ncbi:MAG: tyrosine-protein phosphatase [Puniceicoccales bacterium]|nr:tyrosine-protein phosphatase [Puniceicoccales bacterium]
MKLRLFRVALLGSAIMVSGCTSTPEPVESRPATWAQPASLPAPGNFYQVDEAIFRSAVPGAEHIAALRKAGIRTILNLRGEEGDTAAFQSAGFVTRQYPMGAGRVTQADLVAVLKIIRESPKPVLVHCWHGSDRTGFIIAGYRVVHQGWTKEEAVRELRGGGFGFHYVFANIPATVNALDVEAVRRELDTP